MNYSILEKLDVKLSKLGFGAMRLPTFEDGTINQSAVNDMVAYAIESGVNYFDTSIVYHGGNSEVALGKALKAYDRESYYVADKMSFWGVKTPNQLDEIFKGSLERLDMDYIDFYLMHSLNRALFNQLQELGAIEWAIEKQKQGKIKYLGFSIHDDADLLHDVLEVHDWDFAQIQYNYLDEEGLPGQAGYEELVNRNIPIIIMEPLKGGVLANMPEAIEKPLVKLGHSPASYSFRWLAEKPGIVTILSGMTYIDHVKENIQTFTHLTPLSAEEHAAIQEVKERILTSQKVPCTACKYCLPCPMKINIPDVFGAWNLQSMNQTGNWISGADIDYEAAESCITCGKCMKKCPQHIDIPGKLKELVTSRA